MATVTLTPTYIGTSGRINIFRIDLSQSGLGAISAITIQDDKVISGGGGGVSGFDLDFVKVSTTVTDSAAAVVSLAGEPVFDFSQSGVVFQPGYLQPWSPDDNPDHNTSTLFGTTGANVYSPEASTLGVASGRSDGIGALSLGEGGQLTLLLQKALSTGGRYLYYGDTGSLDGSYVLVSDAPGTIPPGPTGPTGPSQFTLYGTAKSDTIALGVGANAHLSFSNSTVFGLGGSDAIFGAFGHDTLYGGPGHDKLYGKDGNDRAYGGSGNDRIVGGPGDDWLYGQGGNDLVAGGYGKDWISGGTGLDKLSGGRGPDIFVFDTKLSARFNVDRVLDCNPRYDSFYVDNAVFKGIGKGSLAAPGKLSKAAFAVGEEARDASDRFIYNKATGALSYDPDGDGLAAQVQFAQLAPGLRLTHFDFFIC